MVKITIFSAFLCLRRESNPYRQIRNLIFYPLNYEDKKHIKLYILKGSRIEASNRHIVRFGTAVALSDIGRRSALSIELRRLYSCKVTKKSHLSHKNLF